MHNCRRKGSIMRDCGKRKKDGVGGLHEKQVRVNLIY